SSRIRAPAHTKFVLVLRVKCLKSSEQAPMWRNGRRNGLKIRWAVKGPCRFESGHRQLFDTDFCRVLAIYRSCGFRIADCGKPDRKLHIGKRFTSFELP